MHTAEAPLLFTSSLFKHQRCLKSEGDSFPGQADSSAGFKILTQARSAEDAGYCGDALVFLYLILPVKRVSVG